MNRLSIPIGPNDHHQGPLNAAFVLVEYGDYECPYCGEAFPLLKEVKRKWETTSVSSSVIFLSPIFIATPCGRLSFRNGRNRRTVLGSARHAV